MQFLIKIFFCFFTFVLVSKSVFADVDDKLKIGMIISSTGSWAEFGEAQAQAVSLARELHPERFSKIEFVLEDCHYSGKEAVTAFNKLRTVDRVDLVFVWGVEPALAVAPLAESTKTPLFVSAVVASVAQGRKYVIRTINYAEQHSQTMLEYLRSLGYKKLGLIKSQVSFFDVLVDGFRQNLRPDESLEIVDDVLPAEVDFRTSIAKAKNRSFDTLGILLSPSQSLNFFRDAKAQQFTNPIFGSSPLQSRTLIKQAEGAMDGVLFVHNDVSPEFEAVYVKRFGNDIQIPWAANAFDFSLLAGELLSSLSKKPSAEEILKLFSGARVENGAGGPYRYVDSPAQGKYFEYPIVVKKVHGGDFEEVFRKKFH